MRVFKFLFLKSILLQIISQSRLFFLCFKTCLGGSLSDGFITYGRNDIAGGGYVVQENLV